MSCRVVVESQHRHKRKGNIFHVRIDITVPGNEIIVSRDPHKHREYEDVYVAIRDAFDSAARSLREFNEKQQLHVKYHEPESHGVVTLLSPEQDYGLIATGDGREIYFHRNSVLDLDLDDLQVGDRVRFHEEMGEKGPQASTVKLEGKHHVVG